MLQTAIESIIKDLGPTGLLVLGLYFALGRPLTKMAKHLSRINDEIGEIIKLLNRMDARKNGKT